MSVGALDLPAGWIVAEESANELTLREPETKAARAPMSPRAAPRAPRASICVAQAPTERRDPVSAREEFVAAFASAVPGGAKRIDEGAVVFSDGVEGAFVTLSFQVMAGRGVLQRHLFRIEDGRLTRLTATVAEWQLSRLEEINPILISYRSERADAGSSRPDL